MKNRLISILLAVVMIASVVPAALTASAKDAVPGDVDGDGLVTSDDAIYLLYNTLLPDMYPVEGNVDFDNDGAVTSDDAIYLLYFTLLPDLYPLYPDTPPEFEPFVPGKDYEFYAVVADTQVSMTPADSDGNVTITVSGLRNVLTGETKSLAKVMKLEEARAVYETLSEKYDVTGVSKACGEIFIISVKEKKADFSVFSPEVFDDFGNTVSQNWGKQTKYLGVNLGKLDDKYTLVIDGEEVTVQSYTLTVFWGDGKVETVDGDTVKADFTSHDGMPDNDRAFIVIDGSGNATGYVFAPGMAGKPAGSGTDGNGDPDGGGWSPFVPLS